MHRCPECLTRVWRQPLPFSMTYVTRNIHSTLQLDLIPVTCCREMGEVQGGYRELLEAPGACALSALSPAWRAVQACPSIAAMYIRPDHSQ